MGMGLCQPCKCLISSENDNELLTKKHEENIFTAKLIKNESNQK